MRSDQSLVCASFCMHTHTTKGNKREYTVCRAPESSDRHSRQLLKTAAKKAAGSSSIFGAHGRAHMYIPNVYRCDSRRSTTPRPSKAKGAPLNPTPLNPPPPRPAPPRPAPPRPAPPRPAPHPSSPPTHPDPSPLLHVSPHGMSSTPHRRPPPPLRSLHKPPSS